MTTFAVQPGTGMVATEETGCCGSNCTSSLTVESVSLSVGTRNANRAYPPWTALVGLTVTWAAAGAARLSAPATAATSTTAAVRTMRCTVLLQENGLVSGP